LIVSAGQRNIVTNQTATGDHTAWKESGFLMKGKLDFNKIMILTDHSKISACLCIFLVTKFNNFMEEKGVFLIRYNFKQTGVKKCLH